MHRSESNTSDFPRWSLISCYNRASNIPYNEPNLSCIKPLEAVPDEAMMTWETEGLSENTDFLSKDKDEALK
nr:hypothetical protein [Chryseobacterium taichungense]